ncbi:pentapeptide repeat-containing protein [Neisseria sicca]
MKFNKGNEEMVKWKIRQKITAAKDKGKTWLDKQSNAAIVLWAGTVSLIIFMIIYFAAIRNSESISSGAWNLIILIVSSPVAFAIWHFRDKNNRQQIENQRKDINLKEFQKLSEWVSGAHLPEMKIVNKTTQRSSPKDGAEITEQTTEQSEEYAKKPDTADFDTFSKREGAVALQISAIYNLLPFFRGDYGESFRLPAFNLLKSAWRAMQQDSLKKLEKENLSDDERTKFIEELKRKAESPMGVALTNVLLSVNDEEQLNLGYVQNVLPYICLAGIKLDSIRYNIGSMVWSDLNLRYADLRAADLHDVDLTKADLSGADLRETNFSNADLEQTILYEANLQKANLRSAFLQSANLEKANLQEIDLDSANLSDANLIDTKLQHAKLTNVNLSGSNLTRADLQGADLSLANLRDSLLLNIKLDGANFKSVNLSGSGFEWETLKKSKMLAYAQINETDFIEAFYPKWMKNDLVWEALTKNEQINVMQQFCNEKGMIILDEMGKEIVCPFWLKEMQL